MEMHDELRGSEMIYAIVEYGMASEILREAKRLGISGGTIFIGEDALQCCLWDLFGMRDNRKEILLMAADKALAHNALAMLDKKFDFHRLKTGIAFTIPISGITGTNCIACGVALEEREEREAMYQAITVIVVRGKAELAIEAAVRAGSKGGTILIGRGSGINETQRIFAMDIEPEKEIVFLVEKKELTPRIIDAIRQDLKIDEPGNGVVFIQDVTSVYGIPE